MPEGKGNNQKSQKKYLSSRRPTEILLAKTMAYNFLGLSVNWVPKSTGQSSKKPNKNGHDHKLMVNLKYPAKEHLINTCKYSDSPND